MSDEFVKKAQSYQIGDVGVGARIAQGENIAWFEGYSSLPDGEALKCKFDALLQRIATDVSLDDNSRQLALAKTEAVAKGLSLAKQSPDLLRQALLDAKSMFGGAVSWVGHMLRDILKSEAAQKTLGTITEATARAAIRTFTE